MQVTVSPGPLSSGCDSAAQITLFLWFCCVNVRPLLSWCEGKESIENYIWNFYSVTSKVTLVIQFIFIGGVMWFLQLQGPGKYHLPQAQEGKGNQILVTPDNDYHSLFPESPEMWQRWLLCRIYLLHGERAFSSYLDCSSSEWEAGSSVLHALRSESPETSNDVTSPTALRF